MDWQDIAIIAVSGNPRSFRRVKESLCCAVEKGKVDWDSDEINGLCKHFYHSAFLTKSEIEDMKAFVHDMLAPKRARELSEGLDSLLPAAPAVRRGRM